ncbi:MAG TPA: ribonuclease P protein component [Chloroflexia bacterium]|nr:ribonuclease P protein component [Chloroflexia bacterium]
MKRIYSLTKGRQFQYVRARGKSWAHPLLVLVAAPNNLEITRCGFSVGKRLGKAHTRNRLKRVLREAVRVRHPGIKKGYDLVWIARNNLTEDIDFWVIDAVVDSLLRKARLLEFEPPQVGQRPRHSNPSTGEKL